MQVKKFEAQTLQEALDSIKKELGPEAIILQTRRNRKGFGLMSKPSVEVTAAVAQAALNKKKIFDSKLREDDKNKFINMPASRQHEMYDKNMDRQLERAAKRTADSVSLSSAIKQAQTEGKAEKKITITPYVDIQDDVELRGGIERGTVGQSAMPTSRFRAPERKETALRSQNEESMKKEIEELRQIVEQLRHQPPQVEVKESQVASGMFVSDVFTDMVQDLLSSGIERSYAYQLLKKIENITRGERVDSRDKLLEYVAAEILDTVKTTQIFKENQTSQKVIAFVGPTGVGKTTTLAKVASEAILNSDKKVSLINIDRYKVAASDQLETYAKILNVSYRNVNSSNELKLAIQDFKSSDVILIDTTGRSQKDTESLNHMNQMLRTVPNLGIHLVVSTTTRDSEQYEVGKRFAVFEPESLIFSKLDESTVFGSIYNLHYRQKLPISYFTTGQRVPEDIEAATPERVVSLLLNL